ncbi:lysophospholipid acyltransferase family protein [Ureaplasma ceti]|uniref:1-acyl-sn-glycerol-3-phosphate acyltransferase n=1 Tax=Ureaplasma ceti TaxID=3119530 RepID=A0ABP9U5L0_9BACT
MLDFLKKLGWVLAWPFMAIICFIELMSCNTAAKRYAKDPTCAEPEERYNKVKNLVKHLLYFKDIKIAYRGKQKLENKQMLFVANHKSNVDPLIILKTVLDQKVPYITFVAKMELASSKYAGVANLIDTIYLDRGNLREAIKAVNEQADTIQKEKTSVCIFPEGTRVEGDEFGEFKAGALAAAYKTYACIQPVVIYSSQGLLDRDKKWKHKGKRVVDISYMPVIQTNEFINIDKTIFVSRLQQSMHEEYERLAKVHNEPIDNPKFDKEK